MDFDQILQPFVAYYVECWEDAIVHKSKAHESQKDGFNWLAVSSPALLRDSSGNWPQILHCGRVTDNVIVLIHGLTDSPYYLRAIAEDFARSGFNVVLPLLPAHGLQRPGRAFHTLKHTDWIETIDQICEMAQALGHRLSIGGLSTGGALSVYKALKDAEQITGALFLFSAALDIGTVEQLLLQTEAGRMIARLRDQQVWLAKTVKDQLQMILDDQKSGRANEYFGIGENDYKYSVFFYEGVSQLAEVIQAINQHYEKSARKFNDLSQPVFVAHAVDDDSALFRGVGLLVKNHPNDAIALLSLQGVPHASVTLKAAIVDDAQREVCAPANPLYAEMSAQMLAFARRYLSGVI
ncbi:MAG: alpha/beta fold hydrolase [Phormidesmis sp.]